MNKKAVGDTIQGVVSSITESKWAKAIIPTVDELNQTIASNTRFSAPMRNDNVRSSLATMFQGINIPEEEAIRMAKGVNVKNYDSAIDALSDDIAKYTDKPVDKVIARAKDVTQKEISKTLDPSSLPTASKALYPVAYFATPDKTIRNYRVGTAVGAYAGVAVGGRYLTGGTLTRDQYGQKDIAGIPFI